jgi:O-6-methylguanine DNA methyltransferase
MHGTSAIHDIPSYAIFKTAIGWCGLVMAESKLHRVFIGYDRRQQLRQHIRKACGDDSGVNHSFAMEMIIQKVRRYCSGEKVSLSTVPMDWSSLTEFQQKVLLAAAQIPYGSIETYGGLARMIGYPLSARAVGNALGKNPFPLFIPCHRVVKGDGSIGGFSGIAGIPLKKKLLRLEGIRMVW